MKKEHLLKSLLVVLAMSFFSFSVLAASAVGVYKKVTTAPANGDWSGQYLIVCESDGTATDGGPFIFDGSGGGGNTGFVASYIRAMCNVDIANGTIEITQAAVDQLLADNSIVSCGGDMHFTINKDGQLFSAQGYYYGAPSTSGAPSRLKESAIPETGLDVHFNHTITLKSDGTIAMSAQREGKTRYYLRFYVKSATKKFGYYSSTSYRPIHLYKLVENEGGEGGGGDVVVAPEKPTASVESGDYLEAFSVTLACATDGATIKYKLNGGEEQTYSEAINISATTTLVAWAEKEGAKSEEVTFTYNLPTEVANIAALIADKSGKDVRVTSTITVIARSGQSLWVKDASACMLIKGQVGGKSSSYKAGDQFTGLIGKITTVSGVQQITPKNFPATTATGATVEAEIVAPETITADIVHKYIRIEGATYTSKTLLTVGETSFTLMDYFLCLNNNKEVVVGDKVNISVIVALSNGNLQLYPVTIEKAEVETSETPAAPATPTIQYAKGGYFASETLDVALTATETRPNSILVTVDGSEPLFGATATQTLSSVKISATTTVKVRAILMTEEGKPYQNPDGTYVYSEVASATFTKVEAPAAPVFTPVAGDYYDSVIVSIACATKNVKVQYEFGGAEPTGKSATYTEPFKLTTATVVSAMAFLTDEKGTLIFDVAEMPIASPATRAEYKVTPYVAPAAPATPTIQYPEGGYFVSEALEVALTATETRPNSILVTVDGSEPLFGATATQTLSSVKISATTTVKVRAILMTEEGKPYQTPKGEYIYSEVASATFTKVEAPATPVFTPAAGDYYDSVIVSIACATEKVMIKYEFGGTEPTGKSATYTEPFKLTTATVVSAMAFLTDVEGAPIMDVEGMPIASPATFIEYKVAPYVAPEAPAVPTIQYGGGYFTNDMLPVALTTTETRPNYILVTIDGSEPSFEGVQAGTTNPVPAGQQIQLIESKTIKVRGMLMTDAGAPYQTPKGEYIYSEVASATFTKVEVPAAPVFTPAEGEYYDSVVVSIACATENVLVKYEFGGTEPTGMSMTYTEPFKLTTNTVVSAIAFLTDAEGAPIMDVEDLPIASPATFAEYTVKETIVIAAPVFTPEAGEFIDSVAVTLACETENTVILYDLLGLQPNFTSPRFEEGEPIIIRETTTISAMAVLVDEEGEVILNEEEMPYMSELVTATYVVKPGEIVGVEDVELVAVVYAKGDMIYVDTELGNMIEVFTVQGQCIYSAEATSELTSIDAINADVLLVRVNDQVIKVAIK